MAALRARFATLTRMARAPLDNAVAIVTGASSGIGEAIAKQLAPRVRALVLVARRRERLEALVAALAKAHPSLLLRVEACDVSDLAATEAMVARVEREVGPIDVLVNNAGVGNFAMLDLAVWSELHAMIQLNVMALSFLTHRVLPAMVARKRGGILNVSSGFGIEFIPGFAGYVGTKHYVTGFTESLRCELDALGIAVTQSCPGPVATEFDKHLGARSDFAPPPVVTISAEQCARESLRAFERGRAMVVPGFWMKLVMGMGALSPRWIKRWLYGLAAPTLRARQLAARDGTPDAPPR